MSSSISRASFVGMVAVSGLSILLLAGAWIGKMYYEFRVEADRLRTEHYAERKALVRDEVLKGVDVIRSMRAEMVKGLWIRLRERASEAEALTRALLKSNPKLSSGALQQSVVDIFAAKKGGDQGFFAAQDDTIYLMAPFPKNADPVNVRTRMPKIVRKHTHGEHQVPVSRLDGSGSCTLIRVVRHFDNPSIRIVSGACLEEAEVELKKDVVRKLESVQFGVDGYLFGGTWEGISIVGPAKGKNMWGASDASGVKIVQELVAAAKRGGDYVFYVMPPLEGRRHTDKISFAMPVPDWEWYIGAGQYVDDIESVIAENRAKLEQEITEQLLLLFAGLVFIFMLALALSRRLAYKMRQNVQFFLSVWDKASSEGGSVDPAALHYREFKRLARAANEMLEARRSADAQVRESMERFRSLADNIPGIIFQSAVDNRWTMNYISDAVKDLTGYPASDFIGNAVRSFDSIIHRNDRTWVEDNILKSVSDRQPYSLEYRIETSKGETIWVFENGQARYDSDGGTIVLDGAIFDITEKKRAEEGHYKHIHYLETMGRIDREARRGEDMDTVLSDTLEAIRLAFGADRSWLLHPCDPHEPTFSVPFERSSPIYPGARVQGAQVPIAGGLKTVLVKALDSDGPLAFGPGTEHPLPEELSEHFEVQSQLVMAVHPRMGKPWLIGIHQCASARVWDSDEVQLFEQVGHRMNDILSSLLTLQELTTSEERFRTFSEQTLLALCVVQDDRVVFANQSYCDIFEMTVEEMLALPPFGFLELVHPDDREFLVDQARKKQAGDSDVVTSYSWRALTKSGRVRWVEIHSKTVTLKGRPADLVSLIDITESRRSREEMEALIEERTANLRHKAAELEEANRRLVKLDELKSSFVTTVSHDLRTPLTSVIGYAALVRRDLEHAEPFMKDAPEQTKVRDRIFANLDVMESEGRRLTSLIDGFMDLTSMEAGTASWYDALTDMNTCIERAVQKAQAEMSGKPDLEIDLSIRGDLPKLKIDAARFRQMLDHLLSNAIRYTARGTVSVYAESPDGDSLVLSVADTGKGIPEGEFDAIFHPFHQVEMGDTLVDEIKGSGLGLSLCRMIVEHYGGTITVASYLGKGSTFTVILPGKN